MPEGRQMPENLPRTDPDRLAYSVRETTQLLGISKSYVYQLIDRQELEAVKLGRRTLVLAGSISRLLREGA